VVDVQHTLQAKPGLDRIVLRHEQSFHRVPLFAVQKTSRLPGPEVFAFVGLRNVIASYRQKVMSFKLKRDDCTEHLSIPDLATPFARTSIDPDPDVSVMQTQGL